MAPYSPEHWAALMVIAVATPLLVRAVQGRGRDVDRWITIAGWVMFAVSVWWMGWDMRPEIFDIQRSLPLHLSDMARLTTSLALITRKWWWAAPTYYWGLTLNVQSLLTPDLSYFVDPRLEYLMYWLLHAAVFIAPIVLVWGRGMRPTWAWYQVTWVFSLAWMAVTMLINVVTGSNYGYLNAHPPGRSLLDAMGPWPTYLGVGCGILAVTWAGMTWPWVRKSKRRAA